MSQPLARLHELDVQLQLHELALRVAGRLNDPLHVLAEYSSACNELHSAEPHAAWAQTLSKWTTRLVKTVAAARATLDETPAPFADCLREEFVALRIDQCIEEIIEIVTAEIPSAHISLEAGSKLALVQAQPRLIGYVFYQLLRHVSLTSSGYARSDCSVNVVVSNDDKTVSISLLAPAVNGEVLQPLLKESDDQNLHLAACRRILAAHDSVIQVDRDKPRLSLQLPRAGGG